MDETATPKAAGGWWRRFSAFGAGFGFLMVAASLTPSLVPRDVNLQGLVAGALLAFGYGLAVAVHALWRWLGLYEPKGQAAKRLGLLFALFGFAVAAYATVRMGDWQDSVRALMGMPPVDDTHLVRFVAIAVGTAAALLLAGYAVRLLMRFLSVKLQHVVSDRLAVIMALAATAVVVTLLINGVLVRNALAAIDGFYAQLDRLVEPETAPPMDPMRPGSASSLIDWAHMGREGRRFLNGTTSTDALTDFWGDGAEVREPVRVYAGLAAGYTPEERAALALDELVRVGGFDRDVLLITIPTGTGFIDRGAIDTLEYLTKGDIATVAQQYSYLQSPFSLIFEPGYGAATARALFRTIYDQWTEMPPDARPRLYLYGLSLGSLSSEQSVRLHEMLGDPIQGALWAGPPFPSPMHREITQVREPGSPQWQPDFEDGSFVRFMNREGTLKAGDPWGPMRIIYLQHPSDPIVFFDTATLWRQPDWMREPRGKDVTPLMRWYPVVTGLQLAGDMALSNNVPLGHGHQYAPGAYIDAWMELMEPEVSPADVARLKAQFDG